MAETTGRSPYRTVALLGVAVVVLLVVTVALLIPISSSVQTGSEASGSAQPGTTPLRVAGHPLLDQPAPEIDLETLSGERVVLSELQGRPVLVNFWATWCIPCREEFPLMVAAYEEHRGDGLEILGVVHDDSADGSRQFAADLGATWPMPFDGDDRAWNDYVGVGMPTSFFIDTDGIVRAFSLGGFTESGLEAQLRTILPEDTDAAPAESG